MRVPTAAALAVAFATAMLLCAANVSEAATTVTFHYEDGGALYRHAAIGQPLDITGIENTVALGPWYDRDGHQWDPAEPITGDLELWLTVPVPEPVPPEPEPVPMEETTRTGTVIYLGAGAAIAAGIAAGALIWLRRR